MTKLPFAPNFFGVGASKCGTTTLHEILSQHPDILLPKIKETSFFDNYHQHGGLDYYFETYFESYSGEKIIGEITPSYILRQEDMARIKSFAGSDVKILCTLRNPVDRMFSAYSMKSNDANTPAGASFEDFCATEIELIHGKKDWDRRFVDPTDLRRGLYFEQVKRCFDLFGRENVKVLIFETFFSKDMEEGVRGLLQWLGVSIDEDFIESVKATHINKAMAFRFRWLARATRFLDRTVFRDGHRLFRSLVPYLGLERTKRAMLFGRGITKRFINLNVVARVDESKSKVRPETRKMLMDNYFSQDIEKLEALLGIDLSMWKERS